MAGKHRRGSRGPRQTDMSPPLHPCGGREEETPRPWLWETSQMFQQLESGLKPMQTNKQKAQRTQGRLNRCQVFNRGRGRLRQHETQETSAPRAGCCVQETQTVTGRSMRRVQRLFGVTRTLCHSKSGGGAQFSYPRRRKEAVRWSMASYKYPRD